MRALRGQILGGVVGKRRFFDLQQVCTALSFPGRITEVKCRARETETARDQTLVVIGHAGGYRKTRRLEAEVREHV